MILMAEMLPMFRYHPDPLASGSVVASGVTCACCGTGRGFVYAGPVYAEDELGEKLCPWCIADGSAAKKFDATFIDEEVLDDGWPEGVADEIARRTPGYAAWQSEAWPTCCGDATVFLGPAGITELRRTNREWEGLLMSHIVHDLGTSGGAAVRLLGALDRDKGPTVYLFQCLHCQGPKFHIDRP